MPRDPDYLDPQTVWVEFWIAEWYALDGRRLDGFSLWYGDQRILAHVEISHN